ncbi:uncharacterized protein PG986_001094 [Apiospora aurea]|uniref:Arrestin-like N-terminal domain-containing protein n=1 Tax=Apiospora aurea TaxID=335848 RepID=A0ABR1QVU5_9PEZI
MPLDLQQSIAASIELDNFQLSYKPGDVITGNIVRIQLDQPDEVVVTLQFWARVKTRIAERQNNGANGASSTRHYEGESTLFNIAETLYQGRAYEGKNVWPFTVTIPDTHLPPRPAAGNTLPPSHYLRDEHLAHMRQRRNYLYVKYVMEADVRSLTKKGKSALAVLPLNIRTPSSPTPIRDFATRAMATEETLRSLHLLPEYANESLSIRQHMRSVFKRSKIPHYSFAIVVEFPTVIQLEHPTPIPFKIRGIVRTGENETTSAVAEKPPDIHLVSGQVYLRSVTNTDGLDAYSYKLSGVSEGRWNHHPLITRTDFLDFNGKQFVVPMEGKHEHAWIDIGTAVSLGVSTRGVQESGLFRTFQLPLFPSFHSQHVQHVHQMKWELVFACAGKKFEIGGSTRFALWVRVRSIMDIIGPDGIQGAHRAWANGNVDNPILALGMP